VETEGGTYPPSSDCPGLVRVTERDDGSGTFYGILQGNLNGLLPRGLPREHPRKGLPRGLPRGLGWGMRGSDGPWRIRETL